MRDEVKINGETFEVWTPEDLVALFTDKNLNTPLCSFCEAFRVTHNFVQWRITNGGRSFSYCDPCFRRFAERKWWGELGALLFERDVQKCT